MCMQFKMSTMRHFGNHSSTRPRSMIYWYIYICIQNITLYSISIMRSLAVCATPLVWICLWVCFHPIYSCPTPLSSKVLNWILKLHNIGPASDWNLLPMDEIVWRCLILTKPSPLPLSPPGKNLSQPGRTEWETIQDQWRHSCRQAP